MMKNKNKEGEIKNVMTDFYFGSDKMRIIIQEKK